MARFSFLISYYLIINTQLPCLITHKDEECGKFIVYHNKQLLIY